MKLNYFAAFFLLVLTSGSISAQDLVMGQKPGADTIPPTKGPGLKKYTHLFSGTGLVVGPLEGSGASIMNHSSTDFNFGIRHKRKITGLWEAGFDVYYGLTSFKFKQDANKTFPTAVENNREKLNFNHLGLVLFNRIKFMRTGNYIGNFIDLGVYGDGEFMVKHIIINRHPSSTHPLRAGYSRVAARNLEYTEAFNYGVTARLGFNRYVIFGKYRLSNMFKPEFEFPEMPRITAGLQIGLH
jgi:hypothetical protein